MVELCVQAEGLKPTRQATGPVRSPRVSGGLSTRWLWLLGLLTLGLAGCMSEPDITGLPSEQRPDTLPRLSEIQPSTGVWQPAARPGSAGSGSASARLSSRQGVMLRIWRLDVPWNRWLDPAWEQLTPNGLEGGAVGDWRGNGLRAGQLRQADLPRFLQLLGAPVAEGGRQVVSASGWSLLHAGPMLGEVHKLTLDPGQGLSQTLRLRGGRCQILVQAEAEGSDGWVSLTMQPQHHRLNESRLMPRSGFERQLDGQRFTSLTLRAKLARDRLLVLGLDQPPTLPEGEGDSASRYRGRLLDLRLGHLILGGRGPRGAFQSVLIIRATPLPAPPQARAQR